MELLRHRKSCRLGRWYTALHKLAPAAAAHTCIAQRCPVDEPRVMQALMQAYHLLLGSKGAPFALTPCPTRKIAYAYAMFNTCLTTNRHNKRAVPRLVSFADSIPAPLRTTWLRTLAGNAQVPARDYTCVRMAPYAERFCIKCCEGQVADEVHVFLKCCATANVRARFAGSLVWCDGFPTFINTNVARPVCASCIDSLP